MLSTLIGRLRLVGIIEGISYLLLLFIAVPIKYIEALGANPLPVKYLGMAHGVLFVLYCVLILQAWLEYKWPFKTAAILFFGSLVPFGTFYTDKKYLRNADNMQA
jgi:integral membrane protein